MAKAKQPTRNDVIGWGIRLASLYEADALDHLGEGEFVAALRALHVEARKAGIDLTDPEHPVQHVLETINEYDEDHAYELLDDIRDMELRDRRMLAEAESAAAVGRVVSATSEILERSGTHDDELRSGLVAAVARNTPIPDTEYEAVETAREIERAARATVKSISDTDTRAAIMAALPPSASPYGQVRSDHRLGFIQDSMLGEQHRWNADFENAAPTLTDAEVEEAQTVARGEVLAASRGPAALREFREENGLDTSEYA